MIHALALCPTKESHGQVVLAARIQPSLFDTYHHYIRVLILWSMSDLGRSKGYCLNCNYNIWTPHYLGVCGVDTTIAKDPWSCQENSWWRSCVLEIVSNFVLDFNPSRQKWIPTETKISCSLPSMYGIDVCLKRCFLMVFDYTIWQRELHHLLFPRC